MLNKFFRLNEMGVTGAYQMVIWYLLQKIAILTEEVIENLQDSDKC